MKNYYKNMTASGQVVEGAGQLKGIIVNSHASGTITLNDGLTGTAAGVKATAKLTMSDVIVPASHANATLTSSGACVPASHATSKLTTDAPVAGNYVKIGDIIYTATLVENFTLAPYQVAYTKGATAGATFLDNLKHAVNGTGTVGVNYSFGTAAHPQVVATTNTDTTQVFVARLPGVAANTLGTTGTTTRFTWEDTTFGGGTGDSNPGVTTAGATFKLGDNTYMAVVELSETSGADSVANQILWETSEAVFLDNVKLAINRTNNSSQAGTKYSISTVAHPDVVAHTNTNTAQLFVARRPGTAINTKATTTTLANYAFGGTTFVDGVTTDAATVTIGGLADDGVTYTFVTALSETAGATAIPNQVLFGAATANALDNLKLAIDQGATAGTNYSTGTVAHPYVAGSTNSDTEQTVIAKEYAKSYNSIAVSTTLTKGAWGASTLTGGINPAPVICSTITLPAEAGLTSLDRFIKMGNLDFTEGLYFTEGGTCDITFVWN